MKILCFSPSDYVALIRVHNSVYPDYMETVEERKHDDSIGFEKCKLHRWVAEDPNKGIVAFCQYRNDLWDYHPKRFDLCIEVMPEMQGRGIGSMLYDFILGKIVRLSPKSIFCWFRDDDPKNRRFLSERGFVERQRGVNSRLDLASWTEDRSLDKGEELEEAGIDIVTLKEFMEREDWDRTLYDLDKAVALDIPGVSSVPDFETWRKDIFEFVGLLPECYLIAVKDGMAIGTSNVFRRMADGILEVGLTAVRREYRNMGIATTLKQRCISISKSMGAKVLETDNEENNKAILGINMRLGFVRVPDWVKYEKLF